MKVVLAYNDYDSISGEIVFFDNLVRGLADNGLDITICPIKQASPCSFFGKFDNYSRFPLLLKTYHSLKKYEGHDVLHFLNAALSPVGGFLKNRVKVATSHFTPSPYFHLSPPSSKLGYFAESLFCRYASSLDRYSFKSLDCLVACAPYQADYFRSAYGIDRSKLRVIYPGVDKTYFNTLPKQDLRGQFQAEKTVLFLGRLHERSKGISYLIRAIKHIRTPGVKFLLGGDGPDQHYYEALAKKEGVAGQVCFLGRLDFKTKSIIQKSADAIVMPSLFEVFGIVFAESIMLGIPVVAFDLPFWKGLYDEAGIFVKPKDDIALAGAIDDVLTNPLLRDRLVSKGKAISERFDTKKTVKDYIKLYEQLAERPIK